MDTLLTELPLQDALEGGLFSAADKRSRLPPFGDWGLATWLTGSNWEWRVAGEGERKVLEHATAFTSCLRAGDSTWGDFTLEFDVRQMLAEGNTSMDEMFNAKGRAGVMFRYETYRRTYALFLECLNRVVLYCRVEHDWIPLAEKELEIDRSRYYRFRVTCEGDRICCEMDGEPLFDVRDSTYRRGRMAVFANTLSRFSFLQATASPEQRSEMAAYAGSEREAAARSAEGLPEPVLWKRIPCLPRRSSLALDITPDGEIVGLVTRTDDHLFAERDGVALVSTDLDGNPRWSRPATREAFFRIWDIDGDGKQEVVLYDGPTLKLIDAATGELKVEAPTPPCNRMGNRGGREDQKPYIPLYMMFQANVRGLGAGRDMLVFDLYTGFWVINDRLELVWWGNCEHGHDIGLFDIDGDGCDEVLSGYTMFDHDGRELWTMEGVEYMVHTHHHVDHIAIGEFDGNAGNGLEIGLTSGNAGFYLLDQEGKIRVHHDVGHAQSLQVGRFRPDLPGKQFVVGCRWGNPGTRVLIAGNGERLWTIEPDNSYASDLPVRWAPGRDLIAVLTKPETAGFYDGFGRRVLPIPDPHLSVADRAYCACDLTGNGLEDVVVIAKDDLLIYTQDPDNPCACAPGERRRGLRFST